MAFASNQELAEAVLAGNERARARAISLVENDPSGARELVKRLYPHTGRARVLGFTGPPGVGKSTLLAAAAGRFRRMGRSVGIIAVDPSSPFSGGALLGDRLRMSSHFLDDGIFIRSMASRGHGGGLARATGDAVDVLDAAGTEVIIVETVGVGQGEVEVGRLAHLNLLLLVPGLGDEIQALKAGFMEIADLLVVNKADRPDADRTVTDLESSLPPRPDGPLPPDMPRVFRTVATTGEGVETLMESVDRLLGRGGQPGALEDATLRRARARLESILVERALDRLRTRWDAGSTFERMVRRVAGRESDPYTTAAELFEDLCGSLVAGDEEE